MTHAIRFHKTGGPEVLVWEEVNLGKPGPGEARIRHTATPASQSGHSATTAGPASSMSAIRLRSRTRPRAKTSTAKKR